MGSRSEAQHGKVVGCGVEGLPTISPRWLIALGKLKDPPKVPISIMFSRSHATATWSGALVIGSILPLSANPVIRPESLR